MGCMPGSGMEPTGFESEVSSFYSIVQFTVSWNSGSRGAIGGGACKRRREDAACPDPTLERGVCHILCSAMNSLKTLLITLST